MSRTIRTHRNRKSKKSFTLSKESADFLEAVRRERRALSVSSVLEEILQSARRQRARAMVERAVADYYSSLSDDEVQEQANWGEFAMGELPHEGFRADNE